MAILNIGNEVINSTEIAHKVQADIAFLTERLTLLERQHNPNPAVIQIYQDMLQSRELVLDWLLRDQKMVNSA